MRRLLLFLILLFSIVGVLAECSDSQIDINSASLEELESITWVGPVTAQKIIDGRPFSSVDDLDRVKGIGVTKLGDIKDEGLACVSDGSETEVDAEVKEDVGVEEGVVAIDEKIVTEEKENKTGLSIEKVDEPILLNGNVVGERELVYESKNTKISSYLPYAFSLFLIFIIVVLLINK